MRERESKKREREHQERAPRESIKREHQERAPRESIKRESIKREHQERAPRERASRERTQKERERALRERASRERERALRERESIKRERASRERASRESKERLELEGHACERRLFKQELTQVPAAGGALALTRHLGFLLFESYIIKVKRKRTRA